MRRAERFVLVIDRFTCPRCKARRGYRCTYTTGYNVGAFTKQPHWERLDKLVREEARQRSEAWQARRDEAAGHTPERVAVLRANAEAMRREHEDLFLWLRRYSAVLTQAL